MNKLLSNKKAIVLFLFPAFAIFLTFIIVPSSVSLYYSLHDWNGVGAMTFVGIKNYVRLL